MIELRKGDHEVSQVDSGKAAAGRGLVIHLGSWCPRGASDLACAELAGEKITEHEAEDIMASHTNFYATKNLCSQPWSSLVR